MISRYTTLDVELLEELARGTRHRAAVEFGEDLVAGTVASLLALAKRLREELDRPNSQAFAADDLNTLEHMTKTLRLASQGLANDPNVDPSVRADASYRMRIAAALQRIVESVRTRPQQRAARPKGRR